MKPLPCSGGLVAVTVADFIYLFVFGSRVLRYDPQTDSVIQLCSLPQKDWHCFSAIKANDRYIFVIGGASEGVWSQNMFRYDVLFDSWEMMPSMRLPRRRLAAVFVL